MTIATSAFVAIAAGLAAATSGVASASGCTDSWVGGSGDLWDTPGNWSNDVAPVAGDTACISAAGSYSVIIGNEGITVAGLVLGGAGSTATLTIGNGGSGAPNITIGTLTINTGSTLVFGYDGTLTATSVTNSGTFQIPVTGYTATLNITTFDNRGTFEAGGEVTYNLPTSASSLTNDATGTLSVGTSVIMTIASPAGQIGTVTQDGVIDNSGTLYVNDSLDVKGGSICGPVSVGNVTQGNLTFVGAVTSGPACGGSFTTDEILFGNVTGTFTGNIPAAYTLDVGNPGPSAPVITIAGAITNAGTFSFGYDGTITATSTFTNTGTFEVPVTGYTATLDFTDFVNEATFSIGSATTYTLPTSSSQLLNGSTGSLSVSSGVTVNISSPAGQTGTVTEDGLLTNSGTITDLDTLSILGGTVCGNVVRVGQDGGASQTLSFASHVAAGPACAAHLAKGQLFMANIAGTVSGNIPKGWTVDIGDGGANLANVTLSGTTTNAGTLEAGYGATVTDASALTNTGTLEIVKSTYTTTAFNLGGLTNSKNITIKGTGSINLPAATTLTSGVHSKITVSKSKTLNLTENLVNHGILTIDSGGRVDVTGTYTQSGSSSQFIPQLGSRTKYGELNVSGTASLSGTLAPTDGGTFVPPSGSTYKVITSAGLAGTQFTTVSGSFTVQYISSDSDVQLTAD
jgi:hypothetical protein